MTLEIRLPNPTLVHDRIAFRLLGLPSGSPSFFSGIEDFVKLHDPHDAVEPWLDIGSGIIYGNEAMSTVNGGVARLPIRMFHCHEKELLDATDFVAIAHSLYGSKKQFKAVVFENVEVFNAPTTLSFAENQTMSLFFEYVASRAF